MTQTQYNKFYKASIKITGNNKDAKDLMHDVLLMLEKNEKYNNLSDKDKLFFFVRSMKNQFQSNSSYYTRNYKRYAFDELKPTFEEPDTIYQEGPSIDWIKEVLEKEVQKNPDFWYKKGIFELWMQHNGFIERIHKQTKIPRYSIKDTIAEMKVWVNNKWNEYDK